MSWTSQQILQRLRRLHRGGADLSYGRMAQTRQSLLSAAAYHFGSYRSAVEHAGIDYALHCRRPRWTKLKIIVLIKQTRRNGDELNWASVVRRKDELSRAAFAALQPRLFGTWARALHAAGLDADDISAIRKWDRNRVLFELRARHRDGLPMNSAAAQNDDAALYTSAVRYFGSYMKAVRAAGLDPRAIRKHEQWTPTTVIRAIRRLHRQGVHLSDSRMRAAQRPLYAASTRYFGSFRAARESAGVTFTSGRSRS